MTACALADLAPRGDGARALLRCEAEVGAVSTALHFLYAAYQRDARTVAVATMACGR